MEQNASAFLDTLKPLDTKKLKENNAVVAFAKEFLKIETDEKLRARLWGINGTNEGYFLHPTEVLHPKDESGRPVAVLGDGRGRSLTTMGYAAMEELAEHVKKNQNLCRLVIAVWEANKSNLPRVVVDTGEDPVTSMLHDIDAGD